MTLDSLDKDKGDAFDQFKGRTSDFSMDIYSTEMPEKVSPELQALADKVESEINMIGQGKAEEEIISLVDSDEERRLREQRKGQSKATKADKSV